MYNFDEKQFIIGVDITTSNDFGRNKKWRNNKGKPRWK